MRKWWGYIHVNGSIQAKPYFAYRDLNEARSSDFVRTVFDPFLAKDREDAIEKIRNGVALRESS